MLGRKVVGPRRVALAVTILSGDDDIPIVDPAVAIERSDLGKYWESHFDPAHLAFHEGKEPTWFTLKPMTAIQKESAPPDDAKFSDRVAWTLRCTLRGVENYGVLRDDGELDQLREVETTTQGRAGELVTLEWWREANFPDAIKNGLYLMARHISEASLPLSMS